MTIKERIIERLDGMNEAQLKALDQQLEETKRENLEEEFRLLDELAAPMTREQQALFEEAVMRRPLFGGRKLELEPDDA